MVSSAWASIWPQEEGAAPRAHPPLALTRGARQRVVFGWPRLRVRRARPRQPFARRCRHAPRRCRRPRRRPRSRRGLGPPTDIRDARKTSSLLIRLGGAPGAGRFRRRRGGRRWGRRAIAPAAASEEAEAAGRQEEEPIQLETPAAGGADKEDPVEKKKHRSEGGGVVILLPRTEDCQRNNHV